MKRTLYLITVAGALLGPLTCVQSPLTGAGASAQRGRTRDPERALARHLGRCPGLAARVAGDLSDVPEDERPSELRRRLEEYEIARRRGSFELDAVGRNGGLWGTLEGELFRVSTHRCEGSLLLYWREALNLQGEARMEQLSSSATMGDREVASMMAAIGWDRGSDQNASHALARFILRARPRQSRPREIRAGLRLSAQSFSPQPWIPGRPHATPPTHWPLERANDSLSTHPGRPRSTFRPAFVWVPEFRQLERASTRGHYEIYFSTDGLRLRRGALGVYDTRRDRHRWVLASPSPGPPSASAGEGRSAIEGPPTAVLGGSSELIVVRTEDRVSEGRFFAIDLERGTARELLVEQTPLAVDDHGVRFSRDGEEIGVTHRELLDAMR